MYIQTHVYMYTYTHRNKKKSIDHVVTAAYWLKTA